MKLWETYLQPKTVEAALDALRQAPGLAAVVAGGTDLLLDMRQGRQPTVHTLVDVTGIAEMQSIRQDGEHVYLGAAVTHHAIIDNPLIQEHAQCLAEACALVAGPQVRNVATIGGNVAHALPAGDGTIALLALGAEVQMAGPEGRHWGPLGALFAGPGEVTFNRRQEVLVGFCFPLRQARQASAFRRVTRPQGVPIAILNMAANVCCAEDGRIEQVRLAVGPAGRRPFRAVQTEQALQGKPLDEAAIALAVQALLGECQFRTSPHRATSEYRTHLAGVLLERTVTAAVVRCSR